MLSRRYAKRYACKIAQNKRRIQFLKRNWHNIISGIIGLLLVYVTCSSVKVQDKLTDLQNEYNRMNVRPIVEGRFLLNIDFDSPNYKPDIFKFKNIGGDTAFGVWCKVRHTLINDSIIVYAYYVPEPFGYLRGPDGVYGSFTRSAARRLAPGEERQIPTDLRYPALFELATTIDAACFLELTNIYWDDVPQTRYIDKQYFLINRYSVPNNMHSNIEYLDNYDFWKFKIDSLKKSNKIGQMNHIGLHYLGKIFEEKYGDTNFTVLFLYETYDNWKTQYWGWQDTLILYNEKLIPIRDLRKMKL